MRTSLGTRLKQHREGKHIRQEALCEASRVVQSHLSSIENDIRTPSLALLNRLMTALTLTGDERLELLALAPGGEGLPVTDDDDPPPAPPPPA